MFAEAGYRAAKVSDVGARVGVTEPVIFQNFGSKAALFAAAVERAADEVRDSLHELAARPGPATGLLAHVLASPAHVAPGHATAPGAGPPGTAHPGAAYGVLFADAATLAADPALAEPAHPAVRAVAAHLADLVRYAQADGSVRPDADPEAAAWLLLSVLSAQRLRAAAMPPALEPALNALLLAVLAPSAADTTGRGQARPEATASSATARPT